MKKFEYLKSIIGISIALFLFAMAMHRALMPDPNIPPYYEPDFLWYMSNFFTEVTWGKSGAVLTTVAILWAINFYIQDRKSFKESKKEKIERLEAENKQLNTRLRMLNFRAEKQTEELILLKFRLNHDKELGEC